VTAGAASVEDRVTGGSEGKPQRGGEVVEAAASAFDGWQPDNARLLTSINVLPAVYGTLVRISNDGQGVQPMLAESLDFDPNAPSLTVHLEPDAQFSDGKPVTSADVAFSVEQWKAGPNFGGLVAAIESVDTPDEKTAVFNLSVPDTYLQLALAMSNFVVMPENFGGQSADEYFTKPIGAGPFMIESETVNEEIVLVPNPNYFDSKRPYLDTFTVKFILDPNQRSLQFESGDIDFIEPPLPFQEAQQFDDSDVTYVSGKRSNFTQDLIVNWDTPAGGDLKFRRALSLALDREALAAGIFDGRAVPARTTLPPNVPNQVRPSDGTWAVHNLKKAKKLIGESAYDGETLELIINGEQGNTLLLAQAVQEQFEEIGVKTELNELDTQTWLDRWFGNDYEMTMTYNTGNFPSAGGYMSILPGLGWLASNAPIDEAVSAWETFQVATTDTQKDDANRGLEDWAFDNIPWIPIVDTDLPYVVKPDVHVPMNGIGIYALWEIWREK
jgi:peptide/nickel transport system substrate-binding protein